MRFLLVLFVLLLARLDPAAAQKPGEVLPPWSPGELDIHQINTGKGDCIYFIFPDGTTMLADAGSSARKERVRLRVRTAHAGLVSGSLAIFAT